MIPALGNAAHAADAPAGTPEAIPTRTISIELPVYAGNEYQTEKAEGKTESVEYTVIVEAVQGNAITENEEEFVVFAKSEMSGLATELNDEFFSTPTNCVYINELYLTGDKNVMVDQNAPFVLNNVTADVDGSVIIIDGASPAILIYNCDFTLDAGEYIIDASAYGTVYQVFMENVTVNGEVLPAGVCDPAIAEYFANVGWYQVVDPNLNV